MIKTQTLQREVTRLPKRVAGRVESFELPSRKRKRTQPSAKQIGAAVEVHVSEARDPEARLKRWTSALSRSG